MGDVIDFWVKRGQKTNEIYLRENTMLPTEKTFLTDNIWT